MTHELVTSVFGWMAVLNIAVLLFTTVIMVLLHDWIAGVHARMFQMERPDVKRAYFQYLTNYKILTLIFCVIPWLALKLA